ncbi:MAG: chitobiase/beta-hexosaminidase C-terminal domain-containing protein, partial [Terracidiphilus sp.]
SGAPGPGLSEYMLSGGHLAPPAIADFLIGENIIPYSLAFDSNGSIYISDALEVPVNGTTSVAGVYEVDLKNPATINFASTPEGTTNGIPAVVQIINNGTFTLTFSEVSYPADFPFAVGETYVGASGICNVGTSLAAQESCWLVIAFNPTTPLGANSSAELTENISITTNAIPATQSITVSGMETAPLAATPSFSVASGLYSSIQSVTLSDSTTGATIFYTTDGKTTPTSASIKYTGAITVSSNETIQAIAAVPGYANSFVASATYTFQPGFAIAGAPITVTAGATSGNTFAITLTPIGGFTGNVALTAAITSGPSGGIQPTMSFGSTTPTSITNAGAVTSTLTITTTASSATQCSSENRMRQGIPWYSSGGAVLACVLLFGIPARRRSWLKMLGMSLLLVALAGGAIACGGGGGGTNCTPTTTSGTTPGTYTITVTGTSNLSTSTGTVSLTVQ